MTYFPDMHHIAILNKQRKLLHKIISGEKTIESRWYKFRKTPYQNIKSGDIVYFKDSGDPITVKAEVSKTLFFDNLTLNKITDILKKYGKKIVIPVSYAKNLTDKNYCTLIFVTKVKKVTPFLIDKRGYGNMAAWITVDNIKNIKK